MQQRPSFKCAEPHCPFTTSATSPKGKKIAFDKHHAETGHSKMVKIRYDEDPQELSF